MHHISATASAKLILCGEHAAVYSRPAVAVPLHDVCATVQISSAHDSLGLRLYAPDVRRSWLLVEEQDDALAQLIRATLAYLAQDPPNIEITIHSQIPVAGGMGSGAAVSTALVRALASWFAQPISPEETNKLVMISEQRYHGTPSGLDVAVIVWQQPIFFQRRPPDEQGTPQPPIIEPLRIAQPLYLVIGDTGVRSPTGVSVAQVRQRREAAPDRYDAIFDRMATIAREVRQALAQGDTRALGPIFDENQRLLETIGVSSPELDKLIQAARSGGALGAKLSGAGAGGVMFAQATDTEHAEHIAQALRAAGAARALVAVVAG